MRSILVKHRPYGYLAKTSTAYKVVLIVPLEETDTLSVANEGALITCSITTGATPSSSALHTERRELSISIPTPDFSSTDLLEIQIKVDGNVLTKDYGAIQMTDADTDGGYQTGDIVPLLLVKITGSNPVNCTPYLVIDPVEDWKLDQQKHLIDATGYVENEIRVSFDSGEEIDPEVLIMNRLAAYDDPSPADYTEVALVADNEKRRVKIRHINVLPAPMVAQPAEAITAEVLLDN